MKLHECVNKNQISGVTEMVYCRDDSFRDGQKESWVCVKRFGGKDRKKGWELHGETQLKKKIEMDRKEHIGRERSWGKDRKYKRKRILMEKDSRRK